MDQVPVATESIEDFFARYTGDLTAGDIDGLVNIYNYSALGVRPRDIVTDVEVPGIWVGRLVLENLDGSGTPVGEQRPTSGV